MSRGQPTPKTIEDVEAAFSIRLPHAHRAAIHNTEDPIHGACEFLVLDSPGVQLPLYETNAYLRREPIYEWPAYLFAFASNGFGDYYVYDTRKSPYGILYIDPDLTIEENLDSQRGDLTFDSFETWHAFKCTQHQTNQANPGDDEV